MKTFAAAWIVVWVAVGVSSLGCAGGGGGGGGNSPPPTGCGSCAPWEFCGGSTCQFDTSSQWDVIAENGTVSQRDSLGETWDAFGGAPDPFVCMTLNGTTKCTVPRADTFTPTWNTTLFQTASAAGPSPCGATPSTAAGSRSPVKEVSGRCSSGSCSYRDVLKTTAATLPWVEGGGRRMCRRGSTTTLVSPFGGRSLPRLLGTCQA